MDLVEKDGQIKKGNDIFEDDIKKQIEKIKDRKIWLKCGGFITIDKTVTHNIIVIYLNIFLFISCLITI